MSQIYSMSDPLYAQQNVANQKERLLKLSEQLYALRKVAMSEEESSLPSTFAARQSALIKAASGKNDESEQGLDVEA